MPRIQKKTKSSNVLKFSFTETLRLVFTSDEVGVGIVSGVARETESESEESASFHFLLIPLMTP